MGLILIGSEILNLIEGDGLNIEYIYFYIIY